MNKLYTLRQKIDNHIQGCTEEILVFVLSILFLLTVFFIPNLKLLFLAAMILCVVAYGIFGSLQKALLYSYIVLLPFQDGKGLTFMVVSSEYVRQNVPVILTTLFTLSNVFTACLFYVYFRDRIKRRGLGQDRNNNLDASDYLLGGFLLITLFSSLVSNIPLMSFLFSLKQWSYIFIYAYIRTKKLSTWTYNILLPILSSIAIFEGLWSMLQYINKGPLGKSVEVLPDLTLAGGLLHAASENTSFIRMTGTFSHPNYLGFFMAIVVPLLMQHSVSKYATAFGKITCAVGALFGLTALIASGSRTSWIFFILLAMSIIRSSTATSSFHVLPIVKKLYTSYFIFCICLIPIVIVPRLQQLAVTFSWNGGAQFRLNLIQKSLQIAGDLPLGLGLGMFPQALMMQFGKFTSFPTQPHNFLAELLVSSGYPALILFLLFITRIYMRSLHTTKNTSPHVLLRIDTVRKMLFTYLAISMFYPILLEQQIMGWFWILLCIIV